MDGQGRGFASIPKARIPKIVYSKLIAVVQSTPPTNQIFPWISMCELVRHLPFTSTLEDTAFLRPERYSLCFTVHSSEQERTDDLPTRQDWLDNQLELDAKYFVFSDKTLASCCYKPPNTALFATKSGQAWPQWRSAKTANRSAHISTNASTHKRPNPANKWCARPCIGF
jgi:hypothetical protein